jgi:putative transposase
MRSYDVAHQLYVHMTWCTLDRNALIQGDIESEIRSLVEDACKELKLKVIALEMVSDHLHLLVRFMPTHRLSDCVKILKGRSSRLITRKTGREFQWQKGYGIDTVGLKALEVARKYVQDQKEHHLDQSEEAS